MERRRLVVEECEKEVERGRCCGWKKEFGDYFLTFPLVGNIGIEILFLCECQTVLA